MFEVLKRRKKYIALGVVLILLTGGFFGYTKIKGPCLSEMTLRDSVIQGKVTVYKDIYGVPHIYAQNVEDLFFALGYITAADRLWQMDLLRRASSGKISEIFGKDFLEYDYFIRAVGLRRVAENTQRELRGEERIVFESYSKGVNRFISDYEDNLPIEFVLLGYEPEEWTPADSLAIGRLIGWQLAGNYDTELFRMKVLKKIGTESLSELMPPYPEDGVLIIPPRGFELFSFDVPTFNFTNGLGSNNWVVSKRKSSTGNALLANDPHLQINQQPSVWYQAHLNGAGFNTYGVMFPGVPGIIIGRNEHIAWGFTNVGADVEDLYLEKINPKNPHQYWYIDRWEEMQVIEERIGFKGENGLQYLEKEILITRHGPVVSEEEPLSLRWTGEENVSEITAILRMMKARNFEEFKDALKHFHVPAQNIVYADVNGNIAYWMTGKIPIRANGEGLVPQEGWTGENEWIGYIPFEELPHLINPGEGFIVTANNKVIGDDYPYHIAYGWVPGLRAQRIRDLLESKPEVSIEDMMEIQRDNYSLAGENLKRYIVPILIGSQEEDAKKIGEILKAWDNNASKESIGTTIFHVFMIKLAEKIFKDELDEELFSDYLGHQNFLYLALLRSLERGSKFTDDVRTPERESMNDLVIRSAKDTLSFIEKEFGSVDSAKWGEVHTLKFKHPLGQVKLLDMLLSLGPYPNDGSMSTVDNGYFSFRNPFEHITGPSMRLIVELSGDFQNSYIITPSGQCGNRFCSHYSDLAKLYIQKRYHKIFFTLRDVQENTEFVVVFEGG
ncbi:MAG: penicillin acylase family protein [Candidatus Methanofastidiosia archaeon]